MVEEVGSVEGGVEAVEADRRAGVEFPDPLGDADAEAEAVCIGTAMPTKRARAIRSGSSGSTAT